MRARNGEYVTHSAIELHTLFTIGVLAFFLLPYPASLKHLSC